MAVQLDGEDELAQSGLGAPILQQPVESTGPTSGRPPPATRSQVRGALRALRRSHRQGLTDPLGPGPTRVSLCLPSRSRPVAPPTRAGAHRGVLGGLRCLSPFRLESGSRAWPTDTSLLGANSRCNMMPAEFRFGRRRNTVHMTGAPG